MKKYRFFWTLIGVATTLWFVSWVGLRETFDTLKRTDISFLLAATFLTLISQAAVFLKWLAIQKAVGLDLSKRDLLFVYGASLLGGVVTPFRTGEVLSVGVVSEHRGKLASLIFFNRVIEGLTTLFVLIVSFTVFFSGFLEARSWMIILGFVFLICSLMATLSNSRFKEKIMRLTSFLHRSREHLEQEFRRFLAAFNHLVRPRLLLQLFLMGLFMWGCIVTSNWYLFRAVGTQSPWYVLLGFISLSSVSSFLAPTPGGIGIGDILPGYFLMTQGYHDNVAAFILMGRLLTYFSCCLWYFLTLFWTGKFSQSEVQGAQLQE